MPPGSATSPAEDALRRYFGVAGFRPGQREALDALLAGEDALVILPTGGGKSLIYQLAGLLLPGTTLVVSPLIALMRDQIRALQERGYPGAAMLHSQVPDAEQEATLRALQHGRLGLLYVTPERCAEDEFLAVARQGRVSLFAVDEAHCVSEWGHDFRPAYLELARAAESLGRPPILALTATATPWVREDIGRRLGLRRARLIVRGFDRPNLFLEVYPAAGSARKRHLLRRILAEGAADYDEPLAGELRRTSAGSGIV